MTLDDEAREDAGDGEATIDEWLLKALLAADAALAGCPPPIPDSAANLVARSGLAKVDELIDLLVRLRRRPPPRVDDDANGQPDPAPLRIGRFEIVETLGRGGFGVVYLARCPALGREVALKVPLPEILLIPAMRRRFLREARAAGGLDHPNIVGVHEVGEAGPLCYIASAYCKGPTLSSWLKARREPPSPRLAARLIATLSDAVQHAHERGVFHRDIKPSNVILTGLNADEREGDGRREAATTWKLTDSRSPTVSTGRERPEDGGPIPRLTDFGLARIIDEQSDETRTGIPLGSPPYMSPEQAIGLNQGVSPAADVYGLGATLYEVLTGRPPFRGETPTETLRLVREAEPVSPRALRPGLSRDLETICLKCLEKAPARRYPTARALSDDLHRFLDLEPIHARPVPLRVRATKWIRRRPAYAGAALSLAVLVFALVGGVAYRDALLRTHAERTRADSRLLRRHLEAFQLRQAKEVLDANQIERAQDILRAIRDGHGGASDEPDADDLGFAWHYLMREASREVVVLSAHRIERVRSIALSRDGRTIATADDDRTIRIRDIGTWRESRILSGQGLAVSKMSFSPDGRYLASRGDFYPPGLTSLDVWDLHSASPSNMTLIPPSLRAIDSVQFDPDGRSLWTSSRTDGGGGKLECWDLTTFSADPNPRKSYASGTIALESTPTGIVFALEVPRKHFTVYRGTIENPIRRIGPVEHENCLAALSPDGRRIAIGGRIDRTLSVWDVASGVQRIRQVGVDPDILSLVFSPDGRYLLVSDLHDGFELHDLEGGMVRRLARSVGDESKEETPGVRPRSNFAFSPDSRFLSLQPNSIPGKPAVTTVWRLDAWRAVAEYPGVIDWIGEPWFSPDSQHLLVRTGIFAVRWNFTATKALPQPSGHADEAWSLAFSPDGKTLASGSDDSEEPETLKIWDVATGARLQGWHAGEGTISALAFDPTGRVLASADLADTAVVRLWNPADGRPLAALAGHSRSVRTLAFRPDGRVLATAGSDKTIRIWDVAARSCLHVLEGHTDTVRRLSFSPDGAFLVSAANDRTIRVWDVEAGKEISNALCNEKIAAVAYSPDGRTLALADEQGLVTLRDASSHALLVTIETEEPKLLCLAFSPDGRSLAVAGMGGEIGIWDPQTGQSLLTLGGTKAQVNALAFSPDGLTLASCSHDGEVRIWRGRPR